MDQLITSNNLQSVEETEVLVPGGKICDYVAQSSSSIGPKDFEEDGVQDEEQPLQSSFIDMEAQLEWETNDASSSNGVRVTVEECQKIIQRSFQNPLVKFLKEHLEKSGCLVSDNFFKAVNCDQKMSGGYVRGQGIMVCSNYMETEDDVVQAVIHELIHAYDDCRVAHFDWADCAQHACSEIRAGHLSGDCHYKRELLRGYMKLKVQGHEQECIKRRVMKSVTANPYCSKLAAKESMEAVWDICYNDTQPFDRAP